MNGPSPLPGGTGCRNECDLQCFCEARGRRRGRLVCSSCGDVPAFTLHIDAQVDTNACGPMMLDGAALHRYVSHNARAAFSPLARSRTRRLCRS